MKQNEFVGFLATISATTALGIDMVLPAFRDVREAFGLPDDSTQVAITVTVYFLGISLAQLFYGPLTDRFGRKPVLMASLTLYVGAALASSLAPSLPFLLVCRLVWGIGAAGPRVLLMAIARDVYNGDRLARVLSLAAAIFMIVPALAPLLGQLVLSLAGWRWTFGAPLIPAIALMLWATRLDETLEQQDRRPLTLGRTASAFKAVLTNRVSLGFSLALLFDFAAFASFLASSELIFDQVYDRSSQFPLLFGIMSLAMGLTAFTGSKLVSRFGARRLILLLFRFHLPATVLLLTISILGDGQPVFLLWFAMITITNAMRTVFNPLIGSQAMEPMGDLAGTAASVMGTISMGGGALLGSVTDRFIRTSVTPLAVAYVVYGVLELLAVLWAIRAVKAKPASSVPA